MKFSLYTLLIFLFLSTSISTNIYSQSDVTQSATRAGQGRYQDIPYFKRQRIVNEKVKELKEGSLVVRLRTLDSKIEYLKNNGQEKEAKELARSIKELNLSIIEEFKRDYDFSKVFFTYGKLLKKFQDKEEANIFLDENLQINPNITLHGPIFILAAQGDDRFYLYDEDWQRVPEPAPHALYFTFYSDTHLSIDRLIETIAGNTAYLADVYYFNEKLVKIYRKAIRGNKRSRTR